MSKIYTKIDEIIGKTPLLELKKIKKEKKLFGNIIAKLEYFNPGGSVKDRIAKQIIIDAEKKGLINKDTTLIEPTSGNTGIGFAMIAAARGYKLIIVMPETMSIERQKLIRGYGAELILTDGSKGMKGAIEKANEISNDIKNSFVLGQFINPNNPKAHFESTGPEIYEDTDGLVDIFVSGIGTGGTITGAGEYLKSKKPDIKIVAVEPEKSAVLSKGISGKHKIQGIGAGFVPEILNTKIYDEIITVKDEEAFYASKFLARTEGVMTGISSGASLFAGIKLAEKEENKDKNIIVILPDTGERYLSTELFDL